VKIGLVPTAAYQLTKALAQYGNSCCVRLALMPIKDENYYLNYKSQLQIGQAETEER